MRERRSHDHCILCMYAMVSLGLDITRPLYFTYLRNTNMFDWIFLVRKEAFSEKARPRGCLSFKVHSHAYGYKLFLKTWNYLENK